MSRVTCIMSRVTCNSSYWKSQNSSTSQPDLGQFWMVNGQWQDSVKPAWILDRNYTQHLECYFTYYGNKRNNFIYLHLKLSSFNATYNNLDLNWKYFYYIQILGCVFWWTSSNYHVTSKRMIHSPTVHCQYPQLPIFFYTEVKHRWHCLSVKNVNYFYNKI